MILNIYDDDDNVIKTVDAQMVSIRFGSVRSLMKLLKVDDIDNTAELLKTVYGAWEELTKILSKIFPDIEEEDWDGVQLEELIPVLVDILKGSFAKMLGIPNDSKNVIAE